MRSDFYGDLETTVSKIGMKFYSARTGVNVIALPPDGRMFAYNLDSKKVYKVDMKRFNLTGNVPSVTRGRLNHNYVATGKKAKIGGINAVEFVNYNLTNLKRLRPSRQGDPYDVSYSGGVFLPSDIWVASDIALPRKFMFILSKITQIPEEELSGLYGRSSASIVKAPVPLRILRVRSAGRKVMAIDTLSSSKKKVSARDFTVPAGLRPVSSEMALLMDDDASLGFEGAPPDQFGISPSKSTSASKRTMSDLTKELGISPMLKTASPNKLDQKNVLKNTKVSGEKTGQKTAPLKLRPSAF